MNEKEKKIVADALSKEVLSTLQSWSCSPHDIVLAGVIGRGAFGEVRMAEYRGRACAVKTCTKFTKKAMRDFTQECKMMAREFSLGRAGRRVKRRTMTLTRTHRPPRQRQQNSNTRAWSK